MSNPSISEYFKCLLDLHQCDPVLASWAPSGTTSLLIIVGAISVLSICIKLWGDLIKQYLQKNKITLLLLTVFITLLLITQEIIPFVIAVGSLIIYLFFRDYLIKNHFPSKSSLSSPQALIKHDKYFWILILIIYPLSYLATWQWEQHVEEEINKQAKNIQVAFVLPAIDNSGALETSLMQETSQLLAQKVFKDLREILGILFYELQQVEVVPELQVMDKYKLFAKKFTQHGPVLAKALISYRKGQASPVDIAISDYFFTNYTLANKNEQVKLVITIGVNKLDYRSNDIKPAGNLNVRLKGYQDELRRLSLIASYELLVFFVKENLIVLSHEQEELVWTRLLDLFRHYYQFLDKYREAREFNDEAKAILAGSSSCSVKKCVVAIVQAYKSSISDKHSEERMRKVANTIGASIVIKGGDEGVQ